jgi:hypothetical protein
MKNKKFKVMGIVGIAGGVGLELEILGDMARTRFMSRINRWQSIKIDKEGEPYITFRGSKYLLNEFVRENI